MNEKKKENIFKKIEKNILLQVTFFVVSMTVIVGGYVLVSGKIRRNNEIKEINKLGITSGYNLFTDIDELLVEDKELQVSGRIVYLGMPVENIRVLFSNTIEDELIICNVTDRTEKRTEKYQYNQENAIEYGFTTKVKRKDLSSNAVYEVYFVFDSKRENVKKTYKVKSGYYFYDNQMTRHNFIEFERPQIFDEQIGSVLENNNLQFYDSDMGCWIYENEGKLYLIVNDIFGLPQDRSRRMKLHFHTTHKDQLPENRRQYGFDSRDFYFDEKEYVTEGIQGYRIAIVDLPVDYPVSYVEMGMYEPGVKSFRDMIFQLRK